MKALALTNKGIEDIALNEIKEITGADCVVKKRGVIFEIGDYEKLFKLCYLARTLAKVILLIDCFSFEKSPIEEFKRRFPNYRLEEWLDENKFSISGEREGIHQFNSAEMINQLTKVISTKHNCTKESAVKLYFCIFEEDFYFGIDLCGEDLAKRDYRIFLTPESIKGNVAFALLMLGGYESRKTMVDPFCREGIIAIEAALHSAKKSTNFYRKERLAFVNMKEFSIDFEKFFNNMDSKTIEKKFPIYAIDNSFKSIQCAKKNSLIAGLKNFEFSRQDIEWLDLKFKKNEIDLIATYPPQYSQSKDSKKLDKFYELLFYQAEYLLSNNGRIAMLMRTIPESVVSLWLKYKFRIETERNIMQGKEALRAVVLQKNF